MNPDNRTPEETRMSEARKPVGGGEVVLRLTRDEAQDLLDLAEFNFEETSWGFAVDDTRVRTPLGDKIRAAMSDERPGGKPVTPPRERAERAQAREADGEEVAQRWVVDQPDYRCPHCGDSDIGPLHAGDDMGGDYVDAYWCPDCSCEIPEPPKVEVIPVAPLIRWLDDLIERHTQGPLGAECPAAREGAELHIGIYESVKDHIEGRDAHD